MTLIKCCPCGDGTAFSPETNGQCWDCRGTGHLHYKVLDGPECPDDDMLAAFIADERRRGRLEIASMMADWALSYGWEFYQRWLIDYKVRRDARYSAFRVRWITGIVDPYPLVVQEPNSFVRYFGELT